MLLFMLVKKGKIIITCLLILLGAAMLAYGAFFHSTNVSPSQRQDSVVLQSEPALIKEVTVSGVKRDESGQIKKTYDKTPPKSCAT